MSTNVDEKFSTYFEKWVCQLEVYLQQLVSASKHSETLPEEELQVLVSKLTAHHKDYYTQKWAVAREDVITLFSPAGWSSPLENAYTWVTGWKPSIAFSLIERLGRGRSPELLPLGFGMSLAAMTEDQAMRIEKMRVKIKFEEEKVEREMERQQVALADRRMVELSRLLIRIGHEGETGVKVVGLVELAIKNMENGLERVMKAADCVRLKTLKGVLEVLSPLQNVEFLAAMSMFQLRLRQWGKRRQAQLEEMIESENTNALLLGETPLKLQQSY